MFYSELKSALNAHFYVEIQDKKRVPKKEIRAEYGSKQIIYQVSKTLAQLIYSENFLIKK